MRANKLAPVQILTITVSSAFGVRVLTAQYDTVSVAGRDGWISMGLGGLFILLSAVLVFFPLARIHPDMDLPMIIIDVFGKIIGRIFLIPLTLYFLLCISFSLRIFVHAIELFLLSETPISFIVIVSTLCVVYVVSLGINVIGTSVDFMFPVYLLTILFLIAASIPQIKIINLEPLLYNNTIGVLKGIGPAFDSMIGYESILYFLCYTLSSKNTRKWYIIGLIISAFLYTTLTFVTISVFGPEEIKRMVFPTLVLSQAIEFPVTLLERLEAFVAIIWISGVFSWLILFVFASTRNFIVFLSIKPRYEKYITYAHIPILYFIAMFPESGLEAIEYLSLTKYLRVALTLGFITVLYIAAIIKKRSVHNK
ncbi:MAG: GerAB/ArcD/ProY family transporter [Acetivibrionales bacterium]